MEVVLFQDWSAAPEGHTTHHYKAGTVLRGKVADMAMAAGVAFDPREETKVEPPLDVKTINEMREDLGLKPITQKRGRKK